MDLSVHLRDPNRLAALRQLALLDSPAEQAFDRLTKLATQVLHVPVSLVTLVDEDRQFFKSCIGLPEPWTSERETPLSHSFCQHTMTSNGPLVIEDARQHALVRENLAIRDLDVIAYAGIPLVTTDGLILGSFCAIDSQPRGWTARDIEILKNLAESVMTEIELRSEIAARQQAEAALQHLNDILETRVQERTAALQASEERFRALIQQGSDIITILSRDATIRYVSPAIERVLGYSVAEIEGQNTFAFVHPDDAPVLADAFRQTLQTPGITLACEFRFRHRDGTWHILEAIGVNLLDHPAVGGIITNSRDITDRKRTEAEILQVNHQLRVAYDATLEGWTGFLDLRDKETEGHTRRVTELTIRLARAVGLADDAIEHIGRGALLHDVGKMGVPDRILLKPGPLTDEEWIIMRQHPVYAYELLAPIGFLQPALDIPYLHHERWDGGGYPCGLRGDEIPLAARLFAVVDVWDALCSDRPYRLRWPTEQALEHIRMGSGTHFDPDVVAHFMNLIADITAAATENALAEDERPCDSTVLSEQ